MDGEQESRCAGVEKQHRVRGVVIAIVSSLVFALGCTEESQKSQPHPKTATETTPVEQAAGNGVIFVLLADNTLITVSPASGQVEGKVSLGPFYNYRSISRSLASSKDGETLFVIVPGGREEPSRGAAGDRVAAIDVSTLQVHDRYALPEGIIFRSIAVGPKTGHLYLFGNRPASEEIRDVGDTYKEENVVVTVLDPRDGRVLESQIVRRAEDGLNWFVYRGTVSPDENRLFVSYHGPNTTGVDWIEITPHGFVRCRKPGEFEGGACVSSAHGNAEAYKDRLLVATGTPWIEEIGEGGETLRKWDTKLKRNHLMEFAVEADASHLYAVGSCGYTGGLSRVDLETDQVKVLTPTQTGLASPSVREYAVCGERVVPGPGSLLVVGKTATPVPQAERLGSLLMLDGDTGQKLRSVDTPAEPVDVLVVR